MLLKHSKYCCLCDISLFGRICLFLRFGVALGSHFGRFADLWGPFLDFVEVPKNDRYFKSILDAKVDEQTLRHY